ncbi:spore coat protein CotH [Labedella gwakjiensis]|uniref:Spore coat protein CotH n=1 Tax=Labedella gwakjiensis TaxID=390269 RepID=A0A2P8GZA3_9MICO|nr:CotH kinase family protein [Labedella gwakjiensis]PSL39287.1 spore coat protein CotH [Labedella gwakjiensis]RUQ86290.1 hypothetical protein ELQ93_04645 [Labedella gwakjiensis]
MTRRIRFARSTHSTRRAAAVLAVALTAGGLAACSTTSATESSSSVSSAASILWDSSFVHDIEVDVSDEDYDSLIAAYVDDGEKIWVSATVTIDGTVFENVGLKLKGNSSLMGTNADSDPTELPWIIRLDKYVEGQNLDGETELVVRGNSSETSLNEAVALELLGESGLATQEAVSSSFSVNGADAALRLVIQNPNDDWDEQEFGDEGLLYKAESGGDYSYRGDDASAYDGVFDQEAGEDDLTPLIDFLQFINESDDETFAAELSDHLDVEAFATYLAFQDLVQNTDDIDGPGNNSYLRYDPETQLMTVVSWDLNLAFGASPGGGAGGEGGGFPGGGEGMPELPDGAEVPEGMPTDIPTDIPTDMPTDMPDRADGGGGAGGGGMMGGSNVLVERFLENEDFAALVDTATEDLQASLIDSGRAQEILDEWTATLLDDATDLVDEATIEEESEDLSASLS